ncbi:MAG: hypothetical protein ACRD08_05305 [Acidimicrobiales bacterium]
MRWLLVAMALAACARRGGPEEERAVSAKTIEEVLAAHTDSLMALPGVVGTAIGLCDGTPCIRVLLADSGAAAKIPARLDGYRVKAEVTGPIRPRGA